MRQCLSIPLSVKAHIKTKANLYLNKGVSRDLLRRIPIPFHVQKPTLGYKQQVPSNWLVNPIWKLIPEVEGARGIKGAILQSQKLWTPQQVSGE